MKKILSVFMFLLMFSFVNVSPSHAFIIFKVDIMGGEVGTMLTKIFKEVQNKLEKVKDEMITKQLGVGYDEFDAWKRQAENWKDIDKDNLVKFFLQSANLVGARNEEVANINKEITRINDIVSDLKTQIEATKSDVYSNLESQKSYYENTIAALEANSEVLKQMAAEDPQNAAEHLAYIASNEKQKKEMQEQIDKLVKGAESQIEGTINAYNERIEAMGKRLEDLYKQLAKFMAKDKTIVDADEALESTQNKFFILPEDKETPELMEKIRINRLIERRESAIRAYENASKTKIELTDENFQAEDAAWNSAGFDTTASTIGADTAVKFKRIAAYRKYAHLLVAEIKMRTANELALLNYYKIDELKDDITKFNLDDYVFKN